MMRTRPRDIEWAAANAAAAEQRNLIKLQGEEIAREHFWRWQRVPAGIARRFARDLPLRTEELASEIQVFDPTLDELGRAIQVARRIYSRLQLPFPEEILP